MNPVTRVLVWVLFTAMGAFSPALAGIQATQTKLTAYDGAESDLFGFSLAMSGNTVVVGAPADDDMGYASGAVYVFKRENNAWFQQQKLTASDGDVWNEFGSVVAVSGDTILAGAGKFQVKPSGEAYYRGVVYIFKRENGIWSQTAILTAPGANSSGGFGNSLAITDDFAVFSAPVDDSDEDSSGGVYIYKRDGDTFTQQQLLCANEDSISGLCGRSVALSGNYLAVGAGGDTGADGLSIPAGAVYVYKYDGAAWLQQAKFLPLDRENGSSFGSSVAVSGNHIIAGNYRDAGLGFNSGAAHIYRLENGTWKEQAKLTASDGAGSDCFGTSVAIDGDTVAVGTALDGDNEKASGFVYIYSLENGTWNEQAKLYASDAQDKISFGAPVVLSGTDVLVGSKQDGDNGEDSGAAYVFELSSGSGGQCSVTIPSDLSFEFANARYRSLTGDRDISLSFKFFGEQNGKLLWEAQDVGIPDLLSCSIPVKPDLSFTINDAVYHSPAFGPQNVWAGFEFFGVQNGTLLWELVGAGGK